MTLGKRVQQLREMQGLSRSELADRVGVHRGYITLIEQEQRENPTLEMLRKLAKGLGVSVAILAEESEGELQAAALDLVSA